MKAQIDQDGIRRAEARRQGKEERLSEWERQEAEAKWHESLMKMMMCGRSVKNKNPDSLNH